MKNAECALAMKTSVFEAEYGLDEQNPINLYDCLIPAIKANNKKRKG